VKAMLIGLFLAMVVTAVTVNAAWPFDPPEAMDRRGELIQVSEEAIDASVPHLIYVLNYSCDHTFLWNASGHNNTVAVDDIKLIGYEPYLLLREDPDTNSLRFICRYRSGFQWRTIWQGRIYPETQEVVFPSYYYTSPGTYFGTIQYEGQYMMIGQWLPQPVVTQIAHTSMNPISAERIFP
jgi:hypothetical protein